MSVAKSYEKYEYFGDIYERDGKEYIKIKYPCCSKISCAKCGGQGFYPKEVRWYYERFIIDHRHAFGFGPEGYIILLLGSHDILDYHFRQVAPRQARYNTIFQWFVPSTIDMPALPAGITTRRLAWTEISTDDKIHDYDIIRALISSFSGIHSSDFVGEVGGRIEGSFTVIKSRLKDARYGNTYIYTLCGEDGNTYSWTTAARKLIDGEIYYLKGTIKEHLKMEGINTTVLTRCKEVS